MDNHMIPDTADLYTALRHSGIAPDGLQAAIAKSPPQVAARLRSVDQGLLRAILRAGQGAAAVDGAEKVVAFLQSAKVAPLFLPEIAQSRHTPLPTGGQRPDMPAFSYRAFDAWFAATGADYGLGLYAEKRSVYATPQFADAASDERRTIHMGIDVFAPAGTPVYAPLDGQVLHLTYNADPLDYGHTLILQHDLAGLRFFTLYGHLGGSLPNLLRIGDHVTAGQHIAHLGDWHENGGWAAHIHFQIMTDMLEQTGGNFFGVGHESLWDIWAQICPDPNLILRLPDTAFHWNAK